MDKIAKDINEGIKNSSVYRQYLICKSNVENNEYLNSLKVRMEELKSLNCKGKDEKFIDEYYELEKKYMNNILVKEYEDSKKEMYELLKDISDILSFK